MVDADFTIPSLPLVASAVADVSEEAPVDTVPKRKVRRSDYPDDERPEEYSFDLQDPENLKPEAGEYDEKHSLYRVGSRNDSLFVRNGKEKFDFTNMHFDLGPAEKIFGPGGVQLKTQGSAELKIGYNYKFTDNPSLSERNRKTTSFDFDEKVNLSMNAKIGDKMDFNLRYNTDATFDFDSKNLKLKYEGTTRWFRVPPRCSAFAPTFSSAS